MRVGQGAVEYIIILGVIILFALIISGTIGGLNINFFKTSASVRTNEISNLLDEISLKYSVDLNGYAQVSIMPLIDVSEVNVSINNCNLTFNELITEKWFTKSKLCSNLKGLSGGKYSFNCTISYVDETGLTHKESGLCKGVYEDNLTSVVIQHSIILSSEADFNEGSYVNTTWGSVRLFGTNVTGTYTSKVFDAGGTVTWRNISWAEEVPYGEELEPESSIKLLMHFNELSGLITDYSGNDNDGSTNGGITYGAEGIFNTGLRFDGVNDYIIINPVNNFPTTEISVEFWMKSSDTNRDGTPISYASSNSDNDFLIYNYKSFSIYRARNYRNTGVSANDGKWHHIVVTWRSSDGAVKLYKDGVNVYSNTLAAGTSITPGGSLVIAHEQDSVGGSFAAYQAFNGTMDEVVIYNRTLSSSEVLEHYKRGILRLNLTYRSCNDPACSGESWSSEKEEAVNINEDNQYFQFKFNFYTGDTSYSPVLHNVTIHYNG